MDQTKQLAPPASVPARPWRSITLAGAAELVARIADVCLHPLIVLPLFFAAAGTSPTGVGRAIALILGTGVLAGTLITPLTAERWLRTRLIVLITTTALAAILLLGLSRTTRWLVNHRLDLTGGPLFVLVVIACCLGIASTLRPAIARVTHADGPWRTRWGRWLLLGSVGTLIGGFVARGTVTRLGNTFPDGFTTLFALAGAMFLLASLILGGLLGSEWYASMDTAQGQSELLIIPELLMNNLAYGRFVFFRIIYACGALADPFYIIYAVRELGANGRILAIYLLALVIARMVGAVGWRALSINGGNPLVLQLTSFVRLLAPITALTLPPLLGSAALRDRLPGGEATSLLAFSIVFVAWGIASAGLDLSAPAIQTALTTPRERIAAQTVTGLALTIAMLALPLGGLIIERLGYSFLFIVALLIGMGTLLAGGLVDEPRVLILRHAPDERRILRRRGIRREG